MAIERGERFLVTTDVEEVAADGRAWIAESKRRDEFVDLFLDPDKKSLESRLADLASVFADDGQTVTDRPSTISERPAMATAAVDGLGESATVS